MELVSGDIRLRPFRLSDADKLAEMANNKKISRNLRDGFPHPYTYEDATNLYPPLPGNAPVTLFSRLNTKENM